MTNDRRVPPSFTPGAGRPRPGETRPIVVGRSTPPAQPAPQPAPPRVTARPGGSAQPVGGAAASQGPARVSGRPAAPAARPAAIPPRGASSQGRAATAPPAPRTAHGSGRATAPTRPPGAPGAPRRPATTAPGVPGTPRRRRRLRATATVVVLALVLLLAWPVGLAIWANGRLQHVDALSGAANTPGTTYLLAGSDERAPDEADGTEGARSDTIMLLHVPVSGPTALISIPRDSYVEIPGYGGNKINATWAFGGIPLLVQTVEQLTGLTIDHYAQVEFGGVEHVVDALGGIELCSDLDVVDEMSGLVWTPGCQLADGALTMRFARMRYSDPKGDIGRAERQRQVIQKVASSAASTQTLVNPARQVRLVGVGTGALTVDQGANVLTLGRLALAFRAATGPGGITGTPPLKDLDYHPGNVGSTVLLDPDATPVFFSQIANGELPPGTVGGIPG